MRITIFLSTLVLITSCKFIDEKIYGPLKPEAKQYIPLLTDSIVAHNPEVVKYIHFDTASMKLKVVYDGGVGDVSEIDLTIEGLDLFAPIIDEDSLNKVTEEQLTQVKLEKQEQLVKDFIEKEVDGVEQARLDSLRRLRLENDSLTRGLDSISLERDTAKVRD